MRYALTERQWQIIQPILPIKPRGVPRVDDRRVLNGIFWVLRSGAPWRDLPDQYGPYTTCYSRFVRGCGPASGIGSSPLQLCRHSNRRAVSSSWRMRSPCFDLELHEGPR